MRFSLQLPTDRVDVPEEFGTASAIGEMARAVEDAGFDAVFVTDHPAPEDRWLAGGGHHALDPFVALSLAAAATHSLRLQTHILVLPYRNPFLLAKSIASLDVASDGRVIVGVATGYLEPEFRALGADFERRNEISDEILDALPRIWSESGLKLEGSGFEAAGITALPHPVQKPHPPLWVGGNSRAAIRRAVERADGWIPFPSPKRLARHARTASIASLDDLAERIAYARTHAQAVGRTRPLDIGFVPFGFRMDDAGDFDAAATREQVALLEAMGVTWITVALPADTRAAFCQHAESFAADVFRRP